MDRNASALMDAPVASTSPVTRRSAETPKVKANYSVTNTVIAIFAAIGAAMVAMYVTAYKLWMKSLSQIGNTFDILSKTFAKREVSSTELAASYTDIANNFGKSAENVLADPYSLSGLNPAAKVEISHQLLSFGDRVTELSSVWGGVSHITKANRQLRRAATIISQEKIDEQARKEFASALNGASTCFRNEADVLTAIPTFIVNGEIIADTIDSDYDTQD